MRRSLLLSSLNRQALGQGCEEQLKGRLELQGRACVPFPCVLSHPALSSAAPRCVWHVTRAPVTVRISEMPLGVPKYRFGKLALFSLYFKSDLKHSWIFLRPAPRVCIEACSHRFHCSNFSRFYYLKVKVAQGEGEPEPRDPQVLTVSPEGHAAGPSRGQEVRLRPVLARGCQGPKDLGRLPPSQLD